MKQMMIALLLVPGLSAVAQDQKSGKFDLTKEEQQVVDLTNAARKKENLPPLTVSPLLTKVARDYSANMAKQQKLDHFLDGKKASDRVKAVGYAFKYVGENIATGDFPVPKMFQGWMDSQLHRDNILDKEYSEIGVGIVMDGQGQSWYTQVFALPKKK
jgi:uncharacterized protein YkwD